MALACLPGCWPPLDEITSEPGETYREEVLADAPLAYWRLEDGAGATTARDETPNHHDARYKGNITFGPGAIASGGNAAILDGMGEQIVVGDLDLLDFTGSKSFSIEAWIKPSMIDGEYRAVVGKETPGDKGPQDGYQLSVDDSPSGILFLRRVGGNVQMPQTEIDDVPAPSTTGFTHVVVTSNGATATATMFVNGVVAQKTMITEPASRAAAPFTWGAHSGEGAFFCGALDELAVYGKALDPARVAAHFAAGTAAP